MFLFFRNEVISTKNGQKDGSSICAVLFNQSLDFMHIFTVFIDFFVI